jgi:hypothetical protein
VPQWRYTCHSDASLVVFPLAHDVLENPLWTRRVMHVHSFSCVKLLFHFLRHHSSLLLDVSALASEGVAPVVCISLQARGFGASAHSCHHYLHRHCISFHISFKRSLLLLFLLLYVQSPLVNRALVYPALAQLQAVDGEVRPRPNDFSSSIQSRIRSSHDNSASWPAV